MDKKKHLDNRTLYNFRFTDRSYQKRIVDRFLSDDSESALWIYGEHGVGKSFFIDEYLKTLSLDRVVHAYNRAEKPSAGDCLQEIIVQLQNNEDSFIQFLKKYKVEISLGLEKIEDNFSLASLLQYMLAKKYFFLDFDCKFHDLADILAKYANEIYSKQKIIFVIDNIQQCDSNSFDVLLDFAQSSQENPLRKFIFISTEDEAHDKIDPHVKKINSEIKRYPMKMPKIPNQQSFIEMLPAQVNLESFTEEDIWKIYSYCGGIPEKLHTLLSNLEREQHISYQADDIVIDREAMIRHMLDNINATLCIDKFSVEEKCVLLTVVCLGIPVSPDMLKTLATYCFSRLFFYQASEDKIWDALYKMCPFPLTISYEGEKALIYTKHDMLFDATLAYFKDQHLYKKGCGLIYDFIISEDFHQFEKNFSPAQKKELIANLAYNSKNFNWITINYDCGKAFFDQQNYIHAVRYLGRLLEVPERISDQQKLVAGIAHYEVGIYDIACNFLWNITDEFRNTSYKYNLYTGKAENMNQNSDNAIVYLEKAMTLVSPNSDEYLYAAYLRQLVLLQIPECWNTAEIEYKNLVENIKKAKEDKDDSALYIPTNAKILAGCFNYYFNEDALDLLNLAESITTKLGLVFERAVVLHNRGFEFIRENNYKSATADFEEAYDILCCSKRHEAAYPKNNLGILKMFQGNYFEAIKDLKQALIYQKSYYVRLTANTMLMQCYRLIGDKENYINQKTKMHRKFKEYLYGDPAIVRKLGINLAICEFVDNKIFAAREIMQQIKGIVRNTSSEYRANNLFNKLEMKNNVFPLNTVFKPSDYYNSLEFDPWYITLSHD